MALVLGTNCGFVLARPTENPAGSTGIYVDNNSTAFRVTAPAGTVNITEIGWYCNNATEAADTDIGIYDNDAVNSKPLNLLASATFAKGTDAGWKYAALNYSCAEGVIYWIAFQCDNTATGTTVKITTTAEQAYRLRQTTSSLPNPWQPDAGGAARLVPVYALYNTGAGGTNCQVNIGDAWKSMAGMQINIGDAWKQVAGMQVNIGDAWKTVF